MRNSTALILFLKAPVIGKVKTRLAKTIGEEKALKVYLRLLEHTFDVVKNSKMPVFVFLDGAPFPMLVKSGFKIKKQSIGDLGERMWNAFEEVGEFYEKVIIIGSDCLGLKESHLIEAKEGLKNKEVVIGPAEDGGYYLLGTKGLHRSLFFNKNWSTVELLKETVEDLENSGLRYLMLDKLRDVDDFEDLQAYPALLQEVN